MLDHAILQPFYTEREMRDEMEGLKKYPIASVCIKPYAIPLAVETVKGTPIGVGTVIGFPHGASVPEVKALETKIAIQQGASEIDMVVNYGKAIGGHWADVRRDIQAVLEVVRGEGSLLKVIFESGLIPSDEIKIGLCGICSELKVDFVKTSTGFGFAKKQDGSMASTGATDHDLQLMRKHCAAGVQVKASGGMRSLDDVLRVIPLGVTRIGTTSTHAIMSQLQARMENKTASVVSTSGY
jgi:deoxyribose-phosphate aldolase